MAVEEALVRTVVFSGEENDSVVLTLVGMLDAGQEVCVDVPEVAVVAMLDREVLEVVAENALVV